MSDKKITCLKCGEEFVFTAGEQEWYAERNLTEPKYCSTCRAERKKAREAMNHNSEQKQDKKAA